MHDELYYQLALTMVPNIGCVQAKILLQHLEPAQIFHAKRSVLEKIEGIGTVRAGAIHSFRDFHKVEEEMRFIEKMKIRPLFITEKDYPRRLLHCYDSPTLLFYKGTANLNAAKIIAVIGTRSHTEYGRQLTEKIVRDLAPLQPLVISGLAFGIDALAHKAALKYGSPTVGVLAHGLDMLYPPEHHSLAREMIRNGGLLTEFRGKVLPDKHHFPTRNRIVAGMTDATIVIETGIKGGSMITAELANGYNKDVFSFPGRITDSKSAGCNQLISSNKAVLLHDAQQLVELMNWEEKKKPARLLQRELFVELNEDEKKIVQLLREKETTGIDELNIRSGLSSSAVAAALLQMELRGIVRSLPGKLYALA